MKNNKFIALSFLAVSAVCGLASCGSKKLPVGKPSVNFYATASLIRGGNRSRVNSSKSKFTEDEIQKTNFVNSECADVVVTDEDKLEFGKQDVVITITPKEFFTFRKYQIDTWIPEGLPARPYVGLGGPHSPYAYPLQEGVAWTFEDKSEAYQVEMEIEGKKQKVTFYKEKYVITVKKDYFQKNIVIDYGNVESLNNPVYVYNSERYDRLFTRTPICGNFASIYVVDSGKSNFAVGSKGATITYRLDNNYNSIYNFDGWDTEMIEASTNDGKRRYTHFSVKAYKKAGDTTYDELAQFDPALGENQLFVPSVIKDGGTPYLSFFINWTLLAEGVEKGYAYKYEDIQVTLGEPTAVCKNEKVTASESVHVYPSGLFQYDQNGKKAPYGGKDAEVFQSFTTYESSKALKFEHVLVHDTAMNPSNPEALVRYSTLFKINATEKRFFSITINGKQNDIDLEYEEINWTNWRSQSDGETNLPYWSLLDKNDIIWYLAQLNPEGRTYGFPEGSDLAGQQNLYYLYTTNPEAVTKNALSIDIKVNPEPEVDTFTLDTEAQQYGSFVNSKEPFSVTSIKRPSVGKDAVELYFRPFEQFVSSGFDVIAEGKENYDAVYLPRESGYAKICIYPKNATGVFAVDTITIKLTPAASALLFNGSDVLGDFVTKTGNKEALYPGFSLSVGKEVSSFDFRFNDNYANVAFDEENEKIGTTIKETDERKIEVLFDEGKGKGVPQTITLQRTDKSTIRVNLETPITINDTKASLKVKIDFVHVYVYENSGGPYVNGINHTIKNLIGIDPESYSSSLSVEITFKQPVTLSDVSEISISSYYGEGYVDTSTSAIYGSKGHIEFSLKKGAETQPTIKTGLEIYIHITWNGSN